MLKIEREEDWKVVEGENKWMLRDKGWELKLGRCWKRKVQRKEYWKMIKGGKVKL